MKCIHCNHPYTYVLGNKQRKCSRCKRKFSPAKIQREKALHNAFTNGLSATQTSRELQMHIATVLKHFDRFRRDIAFECDVHYQHHAHLVTDYDEYLYLPKSLDPKKDIGKVKHFLTLAYEGKVYNLMMPSIVRLGLDTENRNERKLLEKYLTFRKISKLSTQRSTIRRFWEYFESFICQYKGVGDDRFVFYLKEAEWRFNRGIPPAPKRSRRRLEESR